MTVQFISKVHTDDMNIEDKMISHDIDDKMIIHEKMPLPQLVLQL